MIVTPGSHLVYKEALKDGTIELFVEAGALALEDAQLSGEKIDAMYIGNMSAGRFIEQEHIGALIADYAGLATHHICSTREGEPLPVTTTGVGGGGTGGAGAQAGTGGTGGTRGAGAQGGGGSNLCVLDQSSVGECVLAP